MKSQPAPDVPGNTPWQRLGNAVRGVLSVSKEAVREEEARQKKSNQRRKSSAKKRKKT
jgi:hypothetical protein